MRKELQCSAQTVRRRLHRFDAEGTFGLGDRPKPGRPRRLTVEDDSRLIALVRQPPPGRLVNSGTGRWWLVTKRYPRSGV